jgi:hypothetical protein
MARCSVGGRTDALPTTVRGPSLFATAASGALIVREIGAFNTTTTAVAVALGIATAAGTVGTALTEVNESDQTHTILGTGFNTHTANATLTGTRNASIGAAIGAGIIWTFGENGLQIPEGTANGVVIICQTGTAQHLDFYFVWDE